MGYIFDALNRGGSDRHEDERPRDARGDESRPMEPTDAVAPTKLPDEQAALSDGPLAFDVDQFGPAANLGGDLPEQHDDGDDAGPAPIPFKAKGIGEFDYSGVDDRLVALSEPASIMSEEYRSIRTGLLARWQHRRNLVHTITSATPQEGKTITSLNLGASFAELHNRRTIVLEADLRLPQFGKLLALPASRGLVGMLSGECEIEDVIQSVGPNELHVVPAGKRVNNEAVQLLSSQRMIRLLKKLKQEYDHVIIDTPPVIELADAGILGALSDDVLLIARMNRTPRVLIENAAKTLASYNAPVAGLIATDQRRHRNRYYYYRYGYRYHYRYYSKNAA